MPRTVGIIAGAAEAEVAHSFARELAAADCTCVLDQASIDAAPITIIVCSPRAEPTAAMAGMVERAFTRHARLLPVLIDLPSPPPPLAHFLAGLRCLECARAELPAAAVTLREVIARIPVERPAVPPSATSEKRQTRTDGAIDLNTWSRTVRVAAFVSTAFAVWRLIYDATAVLTLSSGSEAFVAWAVRTNALSMVQSPAALATTVGFIGWMQAAVRSLVLAHRERSVRSWVTLIGGYLLALIYPPLAVGTVCRVWSAIGGAKVRSMSRLALVTVWWVTLVIAGFAPVLASLSLSDSFLNLSALAAEPPALPEQMRLVFLLAIGNAASIVTFTLTAVIARGRSRTRSRARTPSRSGAPALDALVLAARSDGLIVNALANRLRKHGIDLYTPSDGRSVDLETYDALVVLGRGLNRLEDADLALLDRAIEAGQPPLFPICWRSDTPPPHLQAHLGPLHWHTLSLGEESVQTVAVSLLRSPRRSQAAPPSGTRLDGTREPGLWLAHVAAAAFLLSAAWAMASLGLALANFDFHALLLMALGADTTPIENAAILQTLFLQNLGWRIVRLLPAATAAAGLVWVLTRLNVHAESAGLQFSGRALFATGRHPHRCAEWLVAGFAFALAVASFDAPALVLLASTVVTLGCTSVLFGTVVAVRRRLRAISDYWGGASSSPPAVLPRPAAKRTWVAPLVMSGAIGVCAFIGLVFALGVSEISRVAMLNPNDHEAAATAEATSRGIAAAELLVVHLPCVGIWWWWLGRLSRDARAAGREGISRGRRALALVPLAGHADLPEIVRDSMLHRYGQTSPLARAAHALALLAAAAWTVSILWLASAAWAVDVPMTVRTLMISNAAFLVFAFASSLMSWLIGLVRGNRRTEHEDGTTPPVARAAVEV